MERKTLTKSKGKITAADSVQQKGLNTVGNISAFLGT